MPSYIVGFKEGKLSAGIESLRDIFARHGGGIQDEWKFLDMALAETTPEGKTEIEALPLVSFVRPNGKVRTI